LRPRALSSILGAVPPRRSHSVHRRRRHPIRDFGRSARHSLRGVGLAVLLSLVVAVALVWMILPAAETTWSVIQSVPDARDAADMQRKAKELKDSGR
jgi:hypothetical protein